MRKIICVLGILLTLAACTTRLEKVPAYSGSFVRGYKPVVYFGFDKYHLDQDAQSRIENWTLYKLNRWPSQRVMVVGYTDNKGSQEYNMKLSQRRAESVKNFLVKRGVDANRISVAFHGKNDLLTDDAAHQDINRRVEMHFYFPKKWGVF